MRARAATEVPRDTCSHVTLSHARLNNRDTAPRTSGERVCSSAVPRLHSHRQPMLRTLLVAVTLGRSTLTAADTIVEDTPHQELTAKDVAGAPEPGRESGRTDTMPSEPATRAFARGLLFIPRLTVDLVLAPVRLGIWTYDRYHVDETWRRYLFTDDMKIGVYPIVMFGSGYGVDVGLRFVDKDLFGANE